VIALLLRIVFDAPIYLSLTWLIISFRILTIY